MTAAILFGCFLILLLLNIPVAICLGSAAVIAMLNEDLPLNIIAVNSQASVTKFVLLAIPFFIFGGNIMERSGISERLINLAQALVGHKRGGLAVVCVMVACFFAAISGSGPATVAALGMILIPAMVKSGYGEGFGAALTATAGGIGLVIPPSISFVVISSITGLSTGKLFLSGVVPGLVWGLSLVVASIFILRSAKLELLPRATGAERLRAFKESVWGLLMPVIILGGIYGGIFTPTEAAAVSAFYGILVGFFIYRNLTFADLFDVAVTSVVQTSVVMFIIMMASLFALVTTISGVGGAVSQVLMDFAGGNKILFLIVVNVIFLLAGCIMDGNSAYYIFLPIMMPVAVNLGIDPIHLCCIMVVNIAIGLVTPPVGANLYVACSISGLSLKKLSWECLPFVIASIIALLFITYIPPLVLYLPGLMR
ncbi:MAG: TRAP transporter large permease [Methylobacteriaceae bacterium]|jgi:C4-dicarboxylate transporter DctM subunit|nr:TRAP transporter large permease [Methylobacteriaceae bacterium]